MFRPFQPPLLKNLPPSQQRQAPPAKRRRLDDEDVSIARHDKLPRAEQLDIPRKPLLAVTNPAATVASRDIGRPQDESVEGYYTVLWCSHPIFGLRCRLLTDSDVPGANPPTRSTRHGTVTV